jgi:hypothetical protein
MAKWSKLRKPPKPEGNVDVAFFEVGTIRAAEEKKYKPKKDYPLNEEGYCAGSGYKVRKDTPRGRSNPKNWNMGALCPKCHKFIYVGKDTTISKHGKKKQPKVQGHCAECSDPIYTVDFLCEKCRG